MKKMNPLLLAIFLLAGPAWAGPHAHGPFPKHSASGKTFLIHQNPHKPGPASSHTALVHWGAK